MSMLWRLIGIGGLLLCLAALPAPALGGAKTIGANARITDAELTSLASAEQPHVAVLGSSAYAVWLDNRTYAPTAFSYNDVFLARSTDGGATWGANVRVSAIGGALTNQRPQVAVAADGTVWVAWFLDSCGAVDANDCGGGGDRRNDILIARSTDGGATFQLAVIADGDNDLRDLHDPALALDRGTGNVALVYHSASGDGFDIYVRIIDVQQGVLRPPLKISAGDGTGRAGELRGPLMGIAARDGLLCAAWEDRRDRGAIYGVCSRDGGLQFGANVAISDGEATAPRLALAPDGGLYAAYRQGGSIVLRRSPDGGASWGEPRVVAAGGPDVAVFDFDLSVDGSGQVALAWSQRVGVGAGTDALLATSIDGGQSFAIVPIEDAEGTAVSNQFMLALATVGDSDPTYAVLAWQDNRNVQRQIWGARLELDGVAPAAPANLRAAPGDTSIALSWDAASDRNGIGGYRVLRASAAGGPYRIISPILVKTTFYRDVGLDAGAYFYRVVAVDGTGNVGPPSNEVRVTAGAGSGIAMLRGTLAYRAGADIRLVDLPGLDGTRTLAPGLRPRFSADGSRLFYYASGEEAIVSEARAGSNRQVYHSSRGLTELYDITGDAATLASVNTVRYFGQTLPAGFCDAFEPAAREARAGAPRYSGVNLIAADVALSADGRLLAHRSTGFCSTVSFGVYGTPLFCIVDVAAGRSSCSANDFRAADFAPSGDWIVFTADLSGQPEVWKARVLPDLSLGDLTQLTRGPAGMAASAPGWSSDGNWVVLSRDSDPGAGVDRRLFVVRADGDSLRALNIAGEEAAWSGGGPPPAASMLARVMVPLVLR